jgi:hypothetical protein
LSGRKPRRLARMATETTVRPMRRVAMNEPACTMFYATSTAQQRPGERTHVSRREAFDELAVGVMAEPVERFGMIAGSE